MDGRIYYLTNKMLGNLQHNWTIEDFAAITELSKPHLQKLFKTEIGTSPAAYLRDLRLEAARALLEKGFARLKEIGFEIGMPDESHFARDFKKKFGMTPTEYRKTYWQQAQAESLQLTDK